MKIFDITLLGSGDDCKSKLYYSASQDATFSGDGITLQKDGVVSLNSYFNIFSCKYFKYTVIDILDITLRFKGSVELSVFLHTDDGDRVIARGSSAAGSSSVTVSINCDAMPKVGYIYAEVKALEDNTIIYGGEFACDVPVRRVKAGVVICTYKRENFIYDNMRRLQDYIDKTPFFCNKVGIFVIDNGRSVDARYLPSEVVLVPNDNVGGAGGFTAGIKLVAASKEEYTHFILMDDDIAFEPEVVDRTVSLLSILKPRYQDASIGGAMLLKDDPCILHELGGIWTGQSVVGSLTDVDVSLPQGIMEGERYRKSCYNAWWYTCMPVTVIDRVGLPLDKLFVKEDDVEYGMRGMSELIHISGIAVWHENFDYKYNGFYEYFVKRNEMIVNALYPKGKGALSQCLKLIRGVGRALVEQRYFIADIIFKAYEDYFKGWDYICNINYPELISSLRSMCPQYISRQEAEDMYGSDLDRARQEAMRQEGNIFKQAYTLNGYLLGDKKYCDLGVADMVKPKPVNLYKKRKVIHYNPYSATAFVTEIDRNQLNRVGGKLIKMLFKLFFGYYCIRRKYRRQIKAYITANKVEVQA